MGLLHSARIDKLEVLKGGHARRAKLFYLRKLTGKAARLTEKEKMEQIEEETAAPPAPAAETKPAQKAAPEPVASR